MYVLLEISLCDATARLNVSHSTLNMILKDRLKFEYCTCNNGKWKWWLVLTSEKKDARINCPLLRQKEEDLTKKMGNDDSVVGRMVSTLEEEEEHQLH